MKIVVLGSTGMLGWAVGNHFIQTSVTDNISLSYRDERYAYGRNKFFFGIPYNKYSFCKIEGDVVINCIGVIKPFAEKNVAHTILVNSVFPHELADYCKSKGIKLIHITTDCVYSGATGAYDENSPHDSMDVYGRSKSMGEPGNCMVIRTSIIGEEVKGKVSFVEWAKSNRGGRLKGFQNHYWNGLTTNQCAKVFEEIIRRDLYQEGVFHVFSPAPVSKYELLNLTNERFKLNLEIESINADPPINRSLTTIKDLNKTLTIPTIQEQINKM